MCWVCQLKALVNKLVKFGCHSWFDPSCTVVPSPSSGTWSYSSPTCCSICIGSASCFPMGSLLQTSPSSIFPHYSPSLLFVSHTIFFVLPIPFLSLPFPLSYRGYFSLFPFVVPLMHCFFSWDSLGPVCFFSNLSGHLQRVDPGQRRTEQPTTVEVRETSTQQQQRRRSLSASIASRQRTIRWRAPVSAHPSQRPSPPLVRRHLANVPGTSARTTQLGRRLAGNDSRPGTSHPRGVTPMTRRRLFTNLPGIQPLGQ